MKKIFLLIVLCLFCQSSYSYEYFDLGKSAYENGRYGQAKEYLGIAVKNRPKKIVYRYYYAQSLAQLGLIEEASEQYQAITLSSPNSEEGQKSARALESLKKYFETKAGEFKLPDEDSENYMSYIIIENKDIKRWNKNVLNVYIPSSNSASIVEKAFQSWAEKTGGILGFNFVPTAELADISVTFVKKLPLINSEGGVIDGMTAMKYSQTDITHADITIQDRDSKEEFSPDKIYATALHLVGHAIGLNTHSENPKDIMYFELTENNTAISKSDIATLKMLYGISEENIKNIHENPSVYSIKLNKAKDYAEAHPNLPTAWSELASAYVAIGNYEKAVESIKKSIELKDDAPILYTQLAGYYEKLGQNDLAVETYKTAYDIQPANKVYLYNWAKACYKNKRPQEAKDAVDTYLMGAGFLSNDEISRSLRKMYKQDKEKEKEKIKKDREDKQKKIEELQQTEQEMFVD